MRGQLVLSRERLGSMVSYLDSIICLAVYGFLPRIELFAFVDILAAKTFRQEKLELRMGH